MAEKNCSSIIDSLLKGMDSLVSSKTVVGEPTKIGDTIILPLVDISFGVGAGASENPGNNGGGGALTGKITPSAVLVIKDGNARLVNIKNQDAVTKILDLVPEVVDKISSMFSKDKSVTDEEALDAAFPEEE